VAGGFGRRIGVPAPDSNGSGLNQVIAVCAALPTFSGRSIPIRRWVDRANSPFCIKSLSDRAGAESNRRGLCGITDHARPTAM